jgi:signal transduction histidine kinase
MAESVALANECLREIRTVSYLLHPGELDELGLESALSQYI